MKHRTVYEMICACTCERFYYDEATGRVMKELVGLKESFHELAATDKAMCRYRIEELEEELAKIDYSGSPPDEDLKGMELCWRHFRLWVAGDGFGNMIMFIIVLNILMMASEHHGQPRAMTDGFKLGNLIFTMIFLWEMIFKHLVLGPVEYWSDSFNCFDGIIVIISVVEVL
jgi:hypothetical protein